MTDPWHRKPLFLGRWRAAQIGIVLLSSLRLNCEPREQIAVVERSRYAYPHARWRIASRRELDNVVLWVSHIQVRHEHTPDQVAFSVTPWRTGVTESRSRSAAAQLAHQIAGTARQYPERFGQLARMHSDDLASNNNNGHWGGVLAANLSPFPEILDALATLDEGSISDVIETEFGFHIFRRDTPPANEEISGVRIVIQHSEAPWLKDTLGIEPVVPRSRQDAIAFATQIYQQALHKNVIFAELVARYSEHPDRVRGGDIGSWSLAKPSPYPQELDRLRRVAIGQIVAPLDTMWGVQILKRTAPSARAEYAMEAIKVAFNPSSPSTATNSKESVRGAVLALAKRVHRDPTLFDRARRELCCLGAERWFEGQEDLPALSSSLRNLTFGEVAREPIEQLTLFIIPRRIDPQQVKPSPIAHTELPTPERPDVEFFVGIGRLGEQDFTEFAEFSTRELVLDRSTRAMFLELHGRDLGGESESRMAGYRRLLAGVKSLLDEDDYSGYIRLQDAYFTAVLLK